MSTPVSLKVSGQNETAVKRARKNVYILNFKKPKDAFKHFPTLRLAVSSGLS
jgi:hypothetical protein